MVHVCSLLWIVQCANQTINYSLPPFSQALIFSEVFLPSDRGQHVGAIAATDQNSKTVRLNKISEKENK